MSSEAKITGEAAVSEQLLETVRELLRDIGKPDAAAKVTLQSSFERELGFASLDLVELLVRVESRFDVELPEDVAETAETPEGWVRAILTGGEQSEQQAQPAAAAMRTPAPAPPSGAVDLQQVLRWWAERCPERVHAELLDEGRRTPITYGQLYRAANRIAAALSRRGVKRNDRVALILATHDDFLFAFCGAVLAGATVVPLYPPANEDHVEEYVRQQVRVLEGASIQALVTFERLRSVARVLTAGIGSQPLLTTVTELLADPSGGPANAFAPSARAVIEYTSGSTGDPKGVVLSHENILTNLRAIGGAAAIGPDDAIVTWLPLASDLGLVGGWLLGLYYGLPVTLLSPLEFLKRPESWLWAIHDSRATLSAAPNFAYELCARQIPSWVLEGLDLSRWRVAVNAGEPVLGNTVDRFLHRFVRFGFRGESLLPCYGLAESTVALCFPPLGREPRTESIDRLRLEQEGLAVPAPRESGLRVYSLGSPLPGHEVRVVARDGSVAGDRVQGQLQFRGPSTAQGYFRRGGVFEPFPAGQWIDSGDLAFPLDGEIFLTGRGKDRILHQGRQLSPEDLEEAAARAIGVEPGSVIAFGVESESEGTERVIVAAESRARLSADVTRVAAAVRRAVEDACGVVLDDVCLLRPGTLPKTANGKLRRIQTRRLFTEGGLQRISLTPAVQLARVALSQSDRLLADSSRRGVNRLRRFLLRVSIAAAAGAAGMLARFGSAFGFSGPFIGWGARAVLALSGRALPERVSAEAPEMWVSQRHRSADPLIYAAATHGAVRIAGDQALEGLSPSLQFLLSPLRVAAGDVSREFAAGRTVVLLPESPAGSVAARCRFRLRAFEAANLAKTRVRASSIDSGGRIRFSGAVRAAHPSAEALRDASRAALAELES